MIKSQDYYDIVLTDIQLHSSAPLNPRPLQRQVERSYKNKQPGRAYSKNTTASNDGRCKFSLPIGMPSSVDGKPVRIFMPKNGIKIMLGKDVVQKIKSQDLSKYCSLK